MRRWGLLSRCLRDWGSARRGQNARAIVARAFCPEPIKYHDNMIPRSPESDLLIPSTKLSYAMTEITLDQADKILATYRSRGRFKGMTDLQIVTNLDYRYFGCTMLAFGMGFVKLTAYNLPNSAISMGVGAMLMAVSLITYFNSRRFAKIRALFESRSPQYLDQIDLSHPPSRERADRPEDW